MVLEHRFYLEHSEDFTRSLFGVEADLWHRSVQLVLEPVPGAHGGGEPGRVGEDVGVVVPV